MGCKVEIKYWVKKLGRQASHKANLHKFQTTDELLGSLWKWCNFTDCSVKCCEWANNKLLANLSNKLPKAIQSLKHRAWLFELVKIQNKHPQAQERAFERFRKQLHPHCLLTVWGVKWCKSGYEKVYK